MKRAILYLAAISVCLTGLGGCGSDNSSTAKQQQKTATVTFSTVSSAHTAPLEGIQISAKIPTGAGVTDVATALTGRNDTGLIAQKVYSSLPPTVSFIVQPVGANPIRFGTFAELKCSVSPGVTLDQSSFTLAPGDIQMTGKDASGSSVSLESQIPVKVSVSFDY